jgi:hypothetical protein
LLAVADEWRSAGALVDEARVSTVVDTACCHEAFAYVHRPLLLHAFHTREFAEQRTVVSIYKDYSLLQVGRYIDGSRLKIVADIWWLMPQSTKIKLVYIQC